MTTLTVTAKGQITLRRDLLSHMGVKPGEQIELQALPGGRIQVRAAGRSGTIDRFIGLLGGRNARMASLGQIDAAAAAGWCGEP